MNKKFLDKRPVFFGDRITDGQNQSGLLEGFGEMMNKRLDQFRIRIRRIGRLHQHDMPVLGAEILVHFPEFLDQLGILGQEIHIVAADPDLHGKINGHARHKRCKPENKNMPFITESGDGGENFFYHD